MKKIYIATSHKFDDKGVENALDRISDAVNAAEALAQKGWYPYIPRITSFWQLIYPHSADFWKNQDEAWLKSCNALVTLYDTESTDWELRIAKLYAIQVFKNVLEVPMVF